MSKEKKCKFCNKEIDEQPPYKDGSDLYHTNCNFLINHINAMNITTLHNLDTLIKVVLKNRQIRY